jgi:ABC-type polar amino acid transport system ATPase subunit
VPSCKPRAATVQSGYEARKIDFDSTFDQWRVNSRSVMRHALDHFAIPEARFWRLRVGRAIVLQHFNLIHNMTALANEMVAVLRCSVRKQARERLQCLNAWD